MRIGAREIGRDQRPYLIAEMSGNHNQSLETALEIVDAAARAGADAIKLQTYTADTMTLNVNAPGFVIDDPASLWNGRQLHDLYEEAHTPWDWHRPIMERAAARGLHCFSSPFDDTAIDFLDSTAQLQIAASAHFRMQRWPADTPVSCAAARAMTYD